MTSVEANTTHMATIATSLDAAEIEGTSTFNYASVLDLRRSDTGTPMPVAESLLKRLANFRVGYEQHPVNFRTASQLEKHKLKQQVAETPGPVMIVTDQPVQLAEFCRLNDIPFRSRNLFIIATGNDYISPAQRQETARQRTAFGSF